MLPGMWESWKSEITTADQWTKIRYEYNNKAYDYYRANNTVITANDVLHVILLCRALPLVDVSHPLIWTASLAAIFSAVVHYPGRHADGHQPALRSADRAAGDVNQ